MREIRARAEQPLALPARHFKMDFGSTRRPAPRDPPRSAPCDVAAALPADSLWPRAVACRKGLKESPGFP